MLEVSRSLNPECEHLRGDMRTTRLGRTFDAVFVHDAVAYMVTEEDLRRAVVTAYAHCRPGGLAIFMPDHITETFTPITEHGGSDAPGGRCARYLEWTWDPDPTDSWVQTEYVFLLRTPNHSVQVVHETHRTGLFARQVWLKRLAASGFEAHAVIEATTEDRTPREVFLGRRLSEDP